MTERFAGFRNLMTGVALIVGIISSLWFMNWTKNYTNTMLGMFKEE